MYYLELINQIETKRKFFVDDLIDNYYHTGAWAFYSPDPLKALECCIWRLGVDNKGNTLEIGFNSNSLCFEGGANSENGNKITNDFINYMKILPDMYNEGEMKIIINELEEKIELIEENMVSYIKEIGKNYEKDPIKGFSLCRILRDNLDLSKFAVKSAKELWYIYNHLVKFSPKVLLNCSTEMFLTQNDKINKAIKLNQTENLPIAWNLIPSNLRRGNNYDAAIKLYSQKINLRNQYLTKNS